jgi:hypothetical protein
MDDVERLKQFLLEIHMHQGRVCENYELCDHVACRSNHMTWELADAALQGMTLEQYRAEKARIRVCLAACVEEALTIRCFKCGAYLVIKNPGPDVYPECKKCHAKDVVVITTERNPDGTINNCALNYEGSAQNCQMCMGGPCPEEHKLRGKVVFRPTNEWAVPPDPEAPRDHLVSVQSGRGFVQKVVHGTPKEVIDQQVDEILGRRK